jgi:Copper type II ascorbate-dependent monooxygenase, C-terminal domain
VTANGPIKERVFVLAAQNNKFVIPPGDPNYEVEGKFEFGGEAKIISFTPHMHLRGKDMEFRAIYPTGEKETLLNVPHYDFSWQLTYSPVKDLVVPKGTVIDVTAHFDNSVNNKNNPDATKVIKYGEQSWDEMMIGFFQVAIDADKPMNSVMPQRKPKPVTPSPTQEQ